MDKQAEQLTPDEQITEAERNDILEEYNRRRYDMAEDYKLHLEDLQWDYETRLADLREDQARELSLFDQNRRLYHILKQHGAVWCPSCGHIIGLGDIAWNNACTEWGTPNAEIEIQCTVCQHEIARILSWREIEHTDDLLDVLETDWKVTNG